MFDLRLNTVDSYAAARPSSANAHVLLLYSAINRFNGARHAAAVERIKGLLLGHARRLFTLAAIPSGQVRGRHYAGVKCVSLDQICGSVGRTGDFDHDFHPLDDRLRERWVGVAMARSQGIPLPPVNLVQVGGCYFVEDGHHRISVARAWGEAFIEAEVTVWDVKGPLPWEKQPAPHSVMQPA
jgi:hypothetical protein